MGINRASGIGETSFPLRYAHSKKYKALNFAPSFGLIVFSVIALMLMLDKGWSQQRGQSGWKSAGRTKRGAPTLCAGEGKSRDRRDPRNRADITFGPGTRVV